MNQFEADCTTVKERVSFDKLNSLRGLIFGQRALQFDAFLKEAPNCEELSSLCEESGKPEIHHAIFDLDGTLVPPYAPITDPVIERLTGYLERGKNVAIYTNSPHSDRLDILRKNGIPIAETGIGKPSLEGFKRLCDAENMNPAHTAMVGNFPITDMPLVREGEDAFFSLNVLVESIPPQRELVESWKKYYRARLFHIINVATAKIVLIRNPNMVRDLNF